MRKIGLVTIGQSPRDDIVPEIRRRLPRGVEILEAGALDGLSTEEIAAHPPPSPERTLVTRLRDGTEAVVDAEFIHRRLRAVIGGLRREVELIGLLCSGPFPKFTAPVPVLIPHELLRGFLSALLLPGPLGVLVPSPRQVRPTEEELRAWGIGAIVGAASPYRDPPEELCRRAAELVEKGAEALLLHCFGYRVEAAERLRARTGKPVVSVRGLFAHALAALL